MLWILALDIIYTITSFHDLNMTVYTQINLPSKELTGAVRYAKISERYIFISEEAFLAVEFLHIFTAKSLSPV